MSKAFIHPEELEKEEEAQTIYTLLEAQLAKLLQEAAGINEEIATKIAKETVPIVISTLREEGRSEEVAIQMFENFLFSPTAQLVIKESIIPSQDLIYQDTGLDPASGGVALTLDPLILVSKVEEFNKEYMGFKQQEQEASIEVRKPEEMFKEFTDYHKKFVDDYIERGLKEKELLAKYMLVPFDKLPKYVKQRVKAYRDALDRSLKKERIGDIMKRAQELESRVKDLYFDHLARKEAPQEIQRKEFELFGSFVSCAAGHQCLLLSQNKEEASFLLLRASMNPRGNEFLINLYSPISEGRFS